MLTGEWWKPGIFDFHTDETAGERFRFRLLELAVAGWACWFAWSWGLYIPRIEAAILPLGIAQHADLSFMSENGLSLWNAAAITSLCAVAFAVHKAAYLPCALLRHRSRPLPSRRPGRCPTAPESSGQAPPLHPLPADSPQGDRHRYPRRGQARGYAGPPLSGGGNRAGPGASRKAGGELGVGERIRFLGKVDEKEVADYYRACDLFAMLSRRDGADVEGLGIAFLDASACGRPVLGNPLGGNTGRCRARPHRSPRRTRKRRPGSRGGAEAAERSRPRGPARPAGQVEGGGEVHLGPGLRTGAPDTGGGDRIATAMTHRPVKIPETLAAPGCHIMLTSSKPYENTFV